MSSNILLKGIYYPNSKDWNIFINDEALALIQENQTISGEEFIHSLGFPKKGDLFLSFNPDIPKTQQAGGYPNPHFEIDSYFLKILINKGDCEPRYNTFGDKVWVVNVDQTKEKTLVINDIEDYHSDGKLETIANNLLSGELKLLDGEERTLKYYIPYSTLEDAAERAKKLSKPKNVPYIQKGIDEY